METTITICGWVLAGIMTLVLAVFIAAAIWGAAFLGYQLSTRFIRERRGWQKIIRESNHKKTRYAAIIMSDRLGYGEDATLREIITDLNKKIKNKS